MKNTVIVAVLVLIIGAGAFFGGMKYQQNKWVTFTRQCSKIVLFSDKTEINKASTATKDWSSSIVKLFIIG